MEWIDNELAEIDTGDLRLNKRTIFTLKQMDNSAGDGLTQCFRTRSDLIAAYRLFDNKFITPEKILSGHFIKTLSRIKKEKTVLMLNDTSSIDYTQKTSVEGLGILESSYAKGLLIHPLIAITPERVNLGMVDVQFWARDPHAHRKSLGSEVRRNEPIEEKESYRWIKSFYKVYEIAKENPQTEFVSVGDRESDILELIVESVQVKEKCANASIIIRVNHDRALPVDKKKNLKKDALESDLLNIEEEKKLKKKLLKAPTLGEIEFLLSPRNSNSERVVRQQIKAIQVTLKGKQVGERTYPSVKINAVCCIEENPPLNEDPICWMFFTTLPIDTLENILDVIKFYLARWEIETFFKVLKSGCKVEERELKTADRIKNLMAVLFILAWRVMYVMNMARKNPEVCCSEFFEDVEWKAVYSIMKKCKAPNRPTLGEFTLMLAVLGGYVIGKNRPPPGPTVIWRGMKKMSNYAEAWESFEKILIVKK